MNGARADIVIIDDPAIDAVLKFSFAETREHWFAHELPGSERCRVLPGGRFTEAELLGTTSLTTERPPELGAVHGVRVYAIEGSDSALNRILDRVGPESFAQTTELRRATINMSPRHGMSELSGHFPAWIWPK